MSSEALRLLEVEESIEVLGDEVSTISIDERGQDNESSESEDDEAQNDYREDDEDSIKIINSPLNANTDLPDYYTS